MKPGTIFLAILLLLLPTLAGAQSEWQVAALGGVFSPSGDDLHDVYGTSTTGQLSLYAPYNERGQIQIAAFFLDRAGDPFFNSPDFNAGNVANLRLIGGTFAFRINPLPSHLQKVYVGMGVDYVAARESIAGNEDSDGNDIGLRIMLAPEIEFGSRVTLQTEASYRWMEMTMRNPRGNHLVNLSGFNILLGVGFKL